MQLRVCFLQKHDLIAEDIDNNGYAHRLSGNWKDSRNIMLGYQMLQRHNISLVYYPVSETVNGSSVHQACIDALSQDRVDVALELISSPVLANNTQQGPAASQMDSMYVTAYKPNHFAEAPHMMEFLAGFSMPYVSLMITSLIVIGIFSWLSFRIHGRVCYRRRCIEKRKSIIEITWSVLAHLLGNFNFTPLGKVKILLVMLMLAITSYRCHLGMVVNTEQVVRTKPLILDSLGKLIEHRVPFVFGYASDLVQYQQSEDDEVKQVMKISNYPGQSAMIGEYFVKSNGDK